MITTNHYESSSRPVEVRFLSDGQVAVDYLTRLGDHESARELVYSVSNPGEKSRPSIERPLTNEVRLNGTLISDKSAKNLITLVERAREAIRNIDPSIADGVRDFRYTSDGYTAVLLVKHVEGRDAYAEIVVDPNGNNPHINGAARAEEPSLRAVTDAARQLHAEAIKVDTALLVKPLPRQK